MFSPNTAVPAFCLLLIIRAAAQDNKTVGIIGGRYARLGELPYQVSLRMNGIDDCGGSLISATFVLTAAHCLEGVDIKKFKVIAGVIDLKEANNGQVFDATKFIIHPRFNTDSLDYDIALIRLSQPAIFNANVQPIAMAPADANYPEYTVSITSGYGVIDPFGTTQSCLKWAHILLWGRRHCNPFYFRNITDSMMCAGDPRGRQGPCEGDSGGPLTVNGVLIAVHSFGYGCGVPYYPSVFQYLPYSRQWVDENINS
ncbi:trypsin-1-like [Drosophila willistoni]|uniref:trypsin-1-like n=1 Tax=Drosophila willistoni TaxID=7260 RepID=UPI000C26CD51|nr:trypsin-1-like [Drosophila willistoni]